MHKQPAPASIKAVIFDFGGVFTRPDVTDALLARFDAHLGFSAGAMRQMLHGGEAWELASTGQISPEEYWARVGAPYEAHLPPEFRAFRQGSFAIESIDEATVAIARQLRARYKLALCSNAMLDLVRILADRLDVRALFDVIIISAEVGQRKPNPAILQLTADRLGVAVKACLLVDDKPRNTEAAEAMGMPAVVFESPPQLAAELAARGLWTPTP